MSSTQTTQQVVKYTTHRNFRSKLTHIKTYDTQARIMGLDIGRKWTGLALSDKDLK